MWHLALVFLSIISLSEATNKCRVLALGGGSDRGAYVAGGIAGLVKNLPSEEVEWDVVTGNGDGAITAFMMAQTKKGTEKAASDNIEKFWSNFSWSDFYDDWPGWVITGMFFRSGLYDASNMYKTVDSLDTGKLYRTMGVGATDLLTAKYVFFNSTKVKGDTLKTGIKASASLGGYYQFVEYQSFKLVDGAIKYPVDLFHGLDLCKDKGFEEKNIIIDVVTPAGAILGEVDPSKFSTLQNTMRYMAISNYDTFMQDIDAVKRDNPDVTIRSIIYPLKAIPDSVQPYDFKAKELKQMIDQGIEDAGKVLKGK